MKTLLHSIDQLYTCDDQNTVIKNAWVLIQDNKILEFGTGPLPAGNAEQAIDLSGCIVTPGFINIHHHFFQSITKAFPLVHRSSVLDWLLKLYPLWVELGPNEMAAATKVAAAELLLSGGTTSVDHSYMVPSGNLEILEAQVQTCREIGLRLHLVVGSAPTLEGNLEELLKPEIGAKLSKLIDPEDRVYDIMRGAARRFHDPSHGALTRVGFGPAGVTYTMPNMMQKIAVLATEFCCGLHTHLHPRPDERQKAADHLQSTPVAFLKQSGWMRSGTWFAHCSQLTDDEMKEFSDNDVGVAHCAHTIPRLGFPLTRISAMREHGVTVGIGVDGCASNDSGSILHDMRLALLLHRIGTPAGSDTEECWLSPYDILLMATRNGAAILGRSDIGQISTGKEADIAAFKLDRVGYAGTWRDPLAALLLAGCDPYAYLTMTSGRVVVFNGQLVSFDEKRILADAYAATETLIRNSGKYVELLDS